MKDHEIPEQESTMRRPHYNAPIRPVITGFMTVVLAALALLAFAIGTANLLEKRETIVHYKPQMWGSQDSLSIGEGSFGSAVRIAYEPSPPPTVNHGLLDRSSSDYSGHVTAVGHHKRVILTFHSSYTSPPLCAVSADFYTAVPAEINAIPTATAVVFLCANDCPDFEYACIAN
jgi:hypothetical protein